MSPARKTITLTSPFDAARFVDELAHEEVGELVVSRGSEVIGGIYVEGGRIPWVAAKGRGRSLSRLLASTAGVEPAALERHYTRCRASNVPLGEDLVARGIVTPDALRRALLLHSSECLDFLCAPDVSAAWHRRTRGYSPKFTFSTTELVTHANALRCPDVAATASSVLQGLFRSEIGDWGAAFLRAGDPLGPLSIAVVGAFPDRAGDLADVARVSASALEASSKPTGAFFTGSGGESRRCAFRRDDCMYVGGLGLDGDRRMVVLRDGSLEEATRRP